MEKLSAHEADGEVERLRRRHSDLDRRLKELEGHLWLSPQEQTERARLKKEKLATKDRLARLTSPTQARA